MNYLAWLSSVRRNWSRVKARPVVRLQPVGLTPDRLSSLRAMLAQLSHDLGLQLELGDRESELVLLDTDYAGRTPTAWVAAEIAGRPAVRLQASVLDQNQVARSGAQAELMRQLCTLPLVRAMVHEPAAASVAPDRTAHKPASALNITRPSSQKAIDCAPTTRLQPPDFESEADSDLQAGLLMGDQPDAEQKALVAHVLQGLHNESTTALVASYGQDAVLRMDFTSRLVALDPLALQGLRVRRDLPLRDDGAVLSERAALHELDEVVWYLGIACGRFILLNQPKDHWNAPLIGLAASQIERYTRQPRHLELARVLQAGPISPANLRRHIYISVRDLRCFIQACLFLGLLRWSS